MSGEPLDLLSPKQYGALAEKLAHWEPLGAEDAYRVMSSPLMANDPPFFRRVLELESEVAMLRALTAVCICWDGSPNNFQGPRFEGPCPECPVHGAIRAHDEARAEIAGLRLDLDTALRTIRALSTPPKDGA